MARPSYTEPPGELDVQTDVLVAILGLEQQQLGADAIRPCSGLPVSQKDNSARARGAD